MITTTDIKLDNWQAVQAHLTSHRLAVYTALSHRGESTSRKLANYMDEDVLTIRPRLTELMQLGFVILTGKVGHEGTYRACSQDEAKRNWDQAQAQLKNPQKELSL